MSEAFYNKFLSFFSRFIILVFLSISTFELLIFYFLNQNIAFLIAYDLGLLCSFVYGVHFFVKYREFKADLYLFFPSIAQTQNNEEEIKAKTGLINEELSLEVCRLYSRGCSFSDIEKKIGFSYPTQTKRELIKGLRVLLKNYGDLNEHKLSKRN